MYLDEKENIVEMQDKPSMQPMDVEIASQVSSTISPQQQNIRSKALCPLLFVLFQTIFTIILVSIVISNHRMSKMFVEDRERVSYDNYNNDEGMYDMGDNSDHMRILQSGGNTNQPPQNGGGNRPNPQSGGSNLPPPQNGGSTGTMPPQGQDENDESDEYDESDESDEYDENYEDGQYYAMKRVRAGPASIIIGIITIISFIVQVCVSNLCIKRVFGFIFMVSYALAMCGLASIPEVLYDEKRIVINGMIITAIMLLYLLLTERCRKQDNYFKFLILPIFIGIVMGWKFLVPEVVLFGCIYSLYALYQTKQLRNAEYPCAFMESLKIYGLIAYIAKDIILYVTYYPIQYLRSFRSKVFQPLISAQMPEQVKFLLTTYYTIMVCIMYFIIQWYGGYQTTMYTRYVREIHDSDEHGFKFRLTNLAWVSIILPFILHFIVMLAIQCKTSIIIRTVTYILAFVEIIFLGMLVAVIASVQLTKYYFDPEENYSTQYFLSLAMILYIALATHLHNGHLLEQMMALLMILVSIPMMLILLVSASENYISTSLAITVLLPYAYYVHIQSKYLITHSQLGISADDCLIGALTLINPPPQIICNIITRCYQNYRQRRQVSQQ